MNDNNIVRPMIDRTPDPWQAEVINAFADCVRQLVRLGRVANQHSLDSHGSHAVEAVKYAAFLTLTIRAFDECMTALLKSGDKRLAVLPKGAPTRAIEEEFYTIVNLFLERGSIDGMGGFEFMVQKYRDDMQARFPEL